MFQFILIQVSSAMILALLLLCCPILFSVILRMYIRRSLSARLAALTLSVAVLSGGSWTSAYAAEKPAATALATPVISPGGGIYTSVQTVSISDSTPGATLYFSPSGSHAFQPYTGPFTVSSSYEVVQAYATTNGNDKSAIASAVFQVQLPPPAVPSLSLASGVYPGPQTLTISDAVPGAEIYYTTDGSYPASNATKYSGPVTISSSQNIVALAFDEYSLSALVIGKYLIASSPTSLAYTFAGNGGQGYGGDGGPATAAYLNQPTGSVFDGAGNLYIADSSNNLIRKVAAGSRIMTTFAGTGTAGYSGDNGPASSAQLHYPTGLSIDSVGNLYFADGGNNAVRKIALSTGVITTIAGDGVADFSGDGGPAKNAELNSPYGTAIDASGNLYISDMQNCRIRKVDGSTGVISTIAGDGTYGYSGDGGPAINAVLGGWIEGIAVDASGNLYMADAGQSFIREVNTATGIITTVAGIGPFFNPNNARYGGDGGPATSAQLNQPEAVTVDSGGNLYIADTFNYVIRKVTASTGVISTVAGVPLGCQAQIGDGGTAASTPLCQPEGVSLDRSGNLYIADTTTNRIRLFTVSGLPPTATAAAPAFSISSGTYGGPQTVTIADSTPGATIYVAFGGKAATTADDIYKGPIDVSGSVTISAIALAPGYLASAPVAAAYTIATPPAAILKTFAGTGVLDSSGAGGPAIDAEVGTPISLATNSAGDVYILDSFHNFVWVVSAATGDISVAAGGGGDWPGEGGLATDAILRRPSAIAVDSANNLYIADSYDNVVRKVAASTGIITTIAGSTTGDSDPDNDGDGGPATAAYLWHPTGLATDSAGNLYIADTGDDEIRKISADTGIITTVAGNGHFPDSGDGGPAVNAGLSEPGAIAFDSSGNLYIAGSSRVRRVDAKTGIITTIAGNGNDCGSTGDGGLATDAEICPQGLAFDASGDLYLSNSWNAVRKVSMSTGVITRVAGSSYTGAWGDGGSATLAQLDGPTGIAFDRSGNLLIADEYNSKIRVLAAPTPATAPAFSLASGTYTSTQTVTITDQTPGAVIYYTTDGTTPTIDSTVYSDAITIASTTRLQAFALSAGYTASSVTSALYTIQAAAAPAVTAVPSSTSITTTQALTVSVTVGGVSGSPTPTGSVILSGGGYTSASAILSSGTATFTIPPGSLAVGVDTLAASYNPDSNSSSVYTSATGSTPAITVTHPKSTPPITVTPSATSVTTAQSFSIAVAVAAVGGGATPTGSVTLSSGSYSALLNLVSGAAAFNLAAGVLPVGSDTLTAAYTPDAASDPGYTSATQTTSVIVTQAIGTATATVTLIPSATTITADQSLSVAVSIAGASGQAVPTGTVTFAAGSYSAQQPLASGGTTFGIPAGALSAGSNLLTASYLGDAVYGISSGTIAVSVVPVVVTAPNPAPVAPGGSATTTVTFSAGSTYSGTMNLTCALTASPAGAQSVPTCSLNPSTITIASGSKVTSTMTVKTTAASTSTTLNRPAPQMPWKRWSSGGGAALLALTFWMPTLRRRFRITAIICAIVVAGVIGCGGGSSVTLTPPIVTLATTPGSYTFTVTGTDSSNAKLTSSATVTVTVQ